MRVQWRMCINPRYSRNRTFHILLGQHAQYPSNSGECAQVNKINWVVCTLPGQFTYSPFGYYVPYPGNIWSISHQFTFSDISSGIIHIYCTICKVPVNAVIVCTFPMLSCETQSTHINATFTPEIKYLMSHILILFFLNHFCHNLQFLNRKKFCKTLFFKMSYRSRFHFVQDQISNAPFPSCLNAGWQETTILG